MHVLSGPFLAAALLLAVAGVPKVARPDATVRALRSVGLPGSGGLVRLLGAVEVAVALGAVVVGGALFAALVAASYLAFAGFVARGLTRGGVLRSCGCFGKTDTPPTVLHLVLNLAAAGIAAVMVVAPGSGLAVVLPAQPRLGLATVAVTAVTAWFAFLALSLLPALEPPAAPSSGRAR